MRGRTTGTPASLADDAHAGPRHDRLELVEDDDDLRVVDDDRLELVEDERAEDDPDVDTDTDDAPVVLTTGRRDRRRSQRRERTGRWVRRTGGVLALLVGLVVVTGVVWGAVATSALQRHARSAQEHVRAVRAALTDGDAGAALAETKAAAADAFAADEDASALPFRVASHVPGSVGRSVRAVRTVTSATDLALGKGALPLLEVAATVEDAHGLLRDDGSFDVERLATEGARVGPAATALARARLQVGTVRPTDLPSSLGDTVTQAKQGIVELSSRAGTAAAALSVLPSALGADGPRSYLVVFQNTAELRPTGGIAGTWALVKVDDGRASLTQTGSDEDLSRLTGQVRDLGADFKANYPEDKTALVQDANLSPHFPYAGQLYSDLWVAQGRSRPDGVIAVDPSGMAPLLQGAGTLQVDGGPAVNADNVVDVMLRGVYEHFATDNNARKQYLSDVVGTAFTGALGGGAVNAATVKGLVSAASGGHIMAWSSHAEEQRQLVRAGIAGALPSPSEDKAGVFLTNTSGVFLTNTAASKLDYYLKQTVTVFGGCEGAPSSMRVVLRNDAPESVPDYVANHVSGIPRTSESLYVALYVPPTRGVSSVTVDGARVPFTSGTERGWSLVRLGVVVPRATDTTIDVALTGAAAPIEHVLTGPMVNAPTVTPAACTK